MRVDELRPLGIFDGLTDEQIQQLIDGGTEELIEPGVVMFREGEYADFWWLLVDGGIDLVRRMGREETVVAAMTAPGQWAGGFRAWDEQGVYLASGRGARPGRVLRVPAGVLRERSHAWFPFGNHLIEGLYRTARSIEATARQRESLVTLGTLAAGLAHEINNPAAAATRTVDSLEASFRVLVSSLNSLARDEISAQQFTVLEALRFELVRPGTPGSGLDPLARADQEQELATWLERHGVDDAWTVAPELAHAGVDIAWCQRAATVLGPAALGSGMAWVASTLSISTLLAEAKESVQRISDLVGGVRSYSQMDRASMQNIDVIEGLDSTLVVLAHKFGAVIVERQYHPGLPRIQAYAGELNQVWTNLIDNAIDAMNQSGTLLVRTSPSSDGDGVIVEIGDTGPGLPPEVAKRAFEAFFTTKDVGRGTGLGLDIARRIVVERHGGTITVDSQPGDTVFRVQLPARRD